MIYLGIKVELGSRNRQFDVNFYMFFNCWGFPSDGFGVCYSFPKTFVDNALLITALLFSLSIFFLFEMFSSTIFFVSILLFSS